MKKIFCCFIASFVLAFSALVCSADTVQVGSVNSSALNYLSAVVYDNPLCHYVIYRVGDYETKLVYGDLSFENNVITSVGAVNVVLYNSRGGSDGGYSYYPTVSFSTSNSFTLTVNNSSLIYSDLGSFASVQRESFLGDYIHYAIEFLGLVMLFLSFFVFNRGRVHL